MYQHLLQKKNIGAPMFFFVIGALQNRDDDDDDDEIDALVA